MFKVTNQRARFCISTNQLWVDRYGGTNSALPFRDWQRPRVVPSDQQWSFHNAWQVKKPGGSLDVKHGPNAGSMAPESLSMALPLNIEERSLQCLFITHPVSPV